MKHYGTDHVEAPCQTCGYCATCHPHSHPSGDPSKWGNDAVQLTARIPDMVIPVSREIAQDTEGLAAHLQAVLSGEIEIKPHVPEKLKRRERLARWLYGAISGEYFPEESG